MRAKSNHELSRGHSPGLDCGSYLLRFTFPSPKSPRFCRNSLFVVTSKSNPVFIRSARAFPVGVWLVEKGTRLNEQPAAQLCSVFTWSIQGAVQVFILSLTSVWVYSGRHWDVNVLSRLLVHISYQRHNVTAYCIERPFAFFEDVARSIQPCAVVLLIGFHYHASMHTA